MFKSKLGKDEILRLYDKKLNSLDLDVESITVHTRYGETNILATGDPANPPIILVHGSNGCAPIALETYANLHKDTEFLRWMCWLNQIKVPIRD